MMPDRRQWSPSAARDRQPGSPGPGNFSKVEDPAMASQQRDNSSPSFSPSKRGSRLRLVPPLHQLGTPCSLPEKQVFWEEDSAQDLANMRELLELAERKQNQLQEAAARLQASKSAGVDGASGGNTAANGSSVNSIAASSAAASTCSGLLAMGASAGTSAAVRINSPLRDATGHTDCGSAMVYRCPGSAIQPGCITSPLAAVVRPGSPNRVTTQTRATSPALTGGGWASINPSPAPLRRLSSNSPSGKPVVVQASGAHLGSRGVVSPGNSPSPDHFSRSAGGGSPLSPQRYSTIAPSSPPRSLIYGSGNAVRTGCSDISPSRQVICGGVRSPNSITTRPLLTQGVATAPPLLFDGSGTVVHNSSPGSWFSPHSTSRGTRAESSARPITPISGGARVAVEFDSKLPLHSAVVPSRSNISSPNGRHNFSSDHANGIREGTTGSPSRFGMPPAVLGMVNGFSREPSGSETASPKNGEPKQGCGAVGWNSQVNSMLDIIHMKRSCAKARVYLYQAPFTPSVRYVNGSEYFLVPDGWAVMRSKQGLLVWLELCDDASLKDALSEPANMPSSRTRTSTTRAGSPSPPPGRKLAVSLPAQAGTGNVSGQAEIRCQKVGAIESAVKIAAEDLMVLRTSGGTGLGFRASLGSNFDETFKGWLSEWQTDL